jgi:HAD superfamily hydrolase (TIGR01450 family)
MLIGCTEPLHTAFDAALVDLDGVTYRGPHAIATAPPALDNARTAGMQLIYVTNNASREPETVSSHLSDLGIPTTVEQVLTAAQAAASLLADHVAPGSRVLIVGGVGLHTAVRNAGYAMVDSAADAPDAVVQGFAPEVGWRDLAQATYAVQRGAVYIASNLDLTLPTEHGMAPGNGSLVGVVTTATGVVPLSAGKPEPTMFHLAAQRIGAERPLVIGDRLDTDLQGARAAGYPGLMVLTGVNDARDAVLAPPALRPSFLGANLACLAEPHPQPAFDDNRWTVGDAAAWVTDGHLTIDGGTDINRARAACAAAWHAVDTGRSLAVETLPELGVAS